MQAKHFDLGTGLHAQPATRNDAAALVDLVRRNVEHLGRYLPPVAETISAEKADAYFDLVEDQTANGTLIDWHLFQDNVLCGDIRLTHIDVANRKTAVAYFLDARYQGHGVIGRAMKRVVAYAFEELRVNRIELRCATSNAPSRRIAERAGFLLEGRLRQVEQHGDHFQDEYVFGLLASEYLARHVRRPLLVAVET